MTKEYNETVKLVWLYGSNSTPDAEAICSARITRTQILIGRPSKIKQIKGCQKFCNGHPRFRLDTGRVIPQDTFGGWRLAEGELARLQEKYLPSKK